MVRNDDPQHRIEGVPRRGKGPEWLGKLSGRWLFLLAPTTWLMWLGGGPTASIGVHLSTLACLAAVLWPGHRKFLSRTATCLLSSALATLALLLLGNDFSHHYVWLYSAEALPWYLKLANLWGGDQGTLLMMATLSGWLATGMIKYRGWAGPGALLICACFASTASIWSPFTATPPADLAELTSRGMNAHLLSIWMALHPPLILLAYALILAPVGAALEALVKGTGDWAVIASRYNRSGWLILSAGLASGMAWAYEDFTFGQFWHWDPVQTAVFSVWALSTAQMHGLRAYRPEGQFSRTLPSLAGLSAVAALTAMTVTRSASLASSHSYVGQTSIPALTTLSVVLLLGVLGCWALSLRRRVRKRGQGEMQLLLKISVVLLAAAAAIGFLHLSQAYLNSWQGVPRPESLKPFFETLARWTTPRELIDLRRVFAQWDVDNFSLNRWLAPLAVLIGVLGGHAFLRLRRRVLGWLSTIAVSVMVLLMAWQLQPLTRFYAGTGLTSQNTVAIFFWLDALALSAAYLGLSVILWTMRTARRSRARTLVTFLGPVALVHFGVMIALMSAIAASVLDSHAQRVLSWPMDPGHKQRFPNGYALSVQIEENLPANDGARTPSGTGGIRNVATVRLFKEEAGQTIEMGSGNALYRDDRNPLEGYSGPVRQLCRILDYRYARYADGPARMLNPFIHRGLWQDLQVWIPPLDYTQARAGGEEQEIVIVVKRFPLMTGIWLGLCLTLIGATALTLFAWFPRLWPSRNLAGPT